MKEVGGILWDLHLYLLNSDVPRLLAIYLDTVVWASGQSSCVNMAKETSMPSTTLCPPRCYHTSPTETRMDMTRRWRALPRRGRKLRWDILFGRDATPSAFHTHPTALSLYLIIRFS